MTPSARSVKTLREEGWLVDVVERWIPKINIRKDLFGMFDLLAVREGKTLAVQVTSIDHIAHRRVKMRDLPALAQVLSAGWIVEIHGWVKKKNRWQVKRENLS